MRRRAWERERSTWPLRDLSRFVTAGGLCWHVQQSGSGPSMLLIHGTGASTHSWRKVIPLLARDHAVTAVDLPGHGFTDSGMGARSSIAGMATALAALVSELDLDVSYCVGHSAGAVVLCRMALDGAIAPRVIIGINGAFVPLAGAAGTLFAPIARLMANAAFVPRLVAWSARNPANVARMIESTGSRLDAEGVDLYTRLVREPQHVAGALEMMGNWDLYSFERELSQLRTPLVLLVGDRDRTVPPRQANWVSERVPGTRIRTLPGLGHLAHEEAPELIAGEVAGICRGC